MLGLKELLLKLLNNSSLYVCIVVWSRWVIMFFCLMLFRGEDLLYGSIQSRGSLSSFSLTEQAS